MATHVLDAWPIMAWLKGQSPAAERVRNLLRAPDRVRPAMNIVNLGEVYYLSAKNRDWRYAERVLKGLRNRLTVLSATDDLVMLAAKLKGRYAISYADGFAAATAILNNGVLVTGDPELRAVSRGEKELRIDWIGSA